MTTCLAGLPLAAAVALEEALEEALLLEAVEPAGVALAEEQAASRPTATPATPICTARPVPLTGVTLRSLRFGESSNSYRIYDFQIIGVDPRTVKTGNRAVITPQSSAPAARCADPG
jgi:hypothetical protein